MHSGLFSGEYGASLAGIADQLYLTYEHAGAIYFRQSTGGASWSGATNLGGGAWPTITQAEDGQAWTISESGGNLLLRHWTGSGWEATETLGAGNYPNLKLGTSGGTVVEWVNTHCSGAPFRLTSATRSLGANSPPVADAQAVTTDEDTAVAITLTGSEPDDDPLTYTVVTGPADGSLSGTAPNLTYTPDPDFNGSDSFTFKVNDGTVDSAPATVSISVSPVNDPPVAVDDAYAVDEDTSLDVTSPGVLANDSDVDGDALTAILVSGSTNGALTLNSDGSFSYTPALNYNGPDSFTYKANDGTADSGVATVTIAVTAVNDPPVADAQSVSTKQDTPVAITLTASDVDADPLSFNMLLGPSHGTLSGSAPNLTYTPNPGFNGTDSFTFNAHDGTVDSNIATVSITISANNPPVADSQSVTTDEDAAVAITLTGSDVDGDPLTYSVVTGPADGSVSGTAPNVTYTPAEDFNGSDTFTYKANDGTADSGLATVSITVTPVNDPPVADAQSVTTAEDTAVAITLTGSDVDGDSLTYSLVTLPANGVLSGTAPNLTYTPALNFNGSDSFTFKVKDGTVDSVPATVSITVTAVNDPPVAGDDSYAVDEDATLSAGIPGVLGNDTDVEGDALTALLVAGPSSGMLTLNSDGSFSYTPALNYNGPDSFTYKANDGTADSGVATVTIAVTAVNDPPVADAQSLTTAEDTAVAIILTGSDPDDDPLTYAVATGPANGSLSGTAPNLTYTPTLNFNGSDSFTFKANDGTAESAETTVLITITPVNDPPIASFSYGCTDLACTFSGSDSSDVDGSISTYVWQFGDGATASGATVAHVYASAGTYTVTLTATDDSGAMDTDVQSLTVSEATPVDIIYVSSSSSGNVGFAFRDEDILAYDTSTDTWSMFFDGSEVGLGGRGVDIDAFYIMEDQSLLLSLATAATVPDLDNIDDSDIVRFVPSSPDYSAGSYEWYLDGSDVGLTKNGEDVDAIGFAPDGRLLISTSGNFSGPGVSGRDEDLVAFSPTELGQETGGTWALYFDGSDVGLADSSYEDLWGTWVDPTTGEIYLTTKGTFSVSGVSGDGADIFVCASGTLGSSTACAFGPGLYWNGSAHGFGSERLDAFAIRRQ